MDSSENNYINNLNNIIIYLNRYVISVFYILGNIGNLLCILIFTKKSWRKNVCVFYFNISVFYNTCYINSYMLGNIFLIGYDINILNSSIILCKLYYYVSFLFSVLLPTILILASIDRLLISSQNIDTRLYSSKRLAYFSISISTIFWMIYCIHAWIKINIQIFDSFISICSIRSSEIYIDFLMYSSVIVNILFFLLMIILSIISFKNVRHIRIIPRQKRKQIRLMTKKDFQLLRCLFIQVIVYIIFSMTLNITTIYSAIKKFQIITRLDITINNFINSLAVFLHHIPYCSIFFVFITISKAFRYELRRKMYNICGKHINPLREDDN